MTRLRIAGSLFIETQEDIRPAHEFGLPEDWIDPAEQPSPEVATVWPPPVLLRDMHGEEELLTWFDATDNPPHFSPTDPVRVFIVEKGFFLDSPEISYATRFALYDLRKVNGRKDPKLRRVLLERIIEEPNLRLGLARHVLRVPEKDVLLPRNIIPLFEHQISDRMLHVVLKDIQVNSQASQNDSPPPGDDPDEVAISDATTGTSRALDDLEDDFDSLCAALEESEDPAPGHVKKQPEECDQNRPVSDIEITDTSLQKFPDGNEEPELAQPDDEEVPARRHYSAGSEQKDVVEMKSTTQIRNEQLTPQSSDQERAVRSENVPDSQTSESRVTDDSTANFTAAAAPKSETEQSKVDRDDTEDSVLTSTGQSIETENSADEESPTRKDIAAETYSILREVDPNLPRFDDVIKATEHSPPEKMEMMIERFINRIMSSQKQIKIDPEIVVPHFIRFFKDYFPGLYD